MNITGKSFPTNILLVFGYDIHGHENIEGVVDSTTNILFIEFAASAVRQ